MAMTPKPAMMMIARRYCQRGLTGEIVMLVFVGIASLPWQQAHNRRAELDEEQQHGQHKDDPGDLHLRLRLEARPFSTVQNQQQGQQPFNDWHGNLLSRSVSRASRSGAAFASPAAGRGYNWNYIDVCGPLDLDAHRRLAGPVPASNAIDIYATTRIDLPHG